MNTFQKISTLAIAFVFAFTTSCTREDVDPSNPNNAEPQAFKVRMTDSPGDFEALDVEIVKIEAYLEGEGWVALNSESQMVSVLDLTNGAETTIANQTDAEVKAGTYTMLKITFGNNNKLEVNASAALELGPIAVSTDGLLDLEFQGEKEIIIAIDEEINATTGADILLDFNVAQSIIQDGETYVINPVLEEIEDAETGVSGQVSGAATAMVTLANENDTLGTFINAEGEFLLRGMTDGIYELTVMPGEAVEGMGSEDLEPVMLEGIIVSQGEITTVGNISF